VEGGKAFRFSPRHPQLPVDFASPSDLLEAAQTTFYALDLTLPEASEEGVVQLGLDAAQQAFVGLPGAASGDKAPGRILDGAPFTLSRSCRFERVVHTGELLGAQALDMDDYSAGVIGRGVLYDVPRHRGVKWLEPGEAVARAELEEIEEAQGLRVEEGDIFVFHTGHHRRRVELGAWDNGYDGEGKAGLHVDTIPWMHERGVAAFLPDGDGETVPSTVDGLLYPIHPLQVTAMGMVVSDSLQLEDVAKACEEEGRWEFLVMCSPLRIQGGTGSPFNPIAVL
jgi:kynurenine formamidase